LHLYQKQYGGNRKARNRVGDNEKTQRMSTLNNSLWSVSCNGSETASDVIKFFEGGKAIIAFPDGTATKGCWAEATDGHFIFQPHCLPENTDSHQVYIGVHSDDIAAGYFCDINNMCCGF